MFVYFALALLIGINALFLVNALGNVVFFHRATHTPRITDGPLVSVIVPARNEERSIRRCIESLLAQEYENYELIVVDDQSTDDTPRILAELAERDPRLHVIRGGRLEPGWLGKPHALSQGAAVARGEILVLTDADTVHTPQSISWAVTNLKDHGVDMLSGYLEQIYGSLGETVIVPTMYAAMMAVPFYLLPRSKSPGLSFAIGQFVTYRAEALGAVGGFESIRASIVDDMAMARRMKEFGFSGIFLDARQAASCRLYTSFRTAFTGIKRSVYSSLGGSPVGAIVVSTLILGVIAIPALATLAGLVTLHLPSIPITIAAVLFATQWALVCWDRDVPLLGFALYPLVFVNLAAIVNASMIHTGFGAGVDWKGRMVRVANGPDANCDDCPSDAPTREVESHG